MANTPNLDLHQWDAGDSFLREEFNEDFGKIDAAVPRIVSGTYVGSGTANHKIPLSFRPKFLVLMGSWAGYSGIAVVTAESYGYAAPPYGGSSNGIADKFALTDDGFILTTTSYMNGAGSPTGYFAIG